MVYVLLAEGFEEIEAIVPIDLLRRADIEVSTVSLTDDLQVRGGHGIVVQADIRLGLVDFAAMDMLVMPGGGGGVGAIAKTPEAMDLLKRAHDEGKLIAAICAAPSLLAKLGVLENRKVVCHPFVSEEIIAAGANLQPELSVVRDKNLITAKAAGASIEFALELVTILKDKETSDRLLEEIFYR